MPSTKEKVAILVSSGILATGLFTAFQPPSPSDTSENHDQQTQQQVGDLSYSQDNVNQSIRDAGNAHADAENAQQLIPGEYRPAEEPRLRLRIAP